MEEFSRQNEAMGMREELMDDALIDAFDGDQEEEENAIVDQVLAEVGMQATAGMIDAPGSKPVIAQRESAATEEEKLADQRADELLKQLGAL